MRTRHRASALDRGQPCGTPFHAHACRIFATRFGGKITYLTADGRFALVGQLLDLETLENLTEVAQRRQRVALAEFGEQNMVVFPASGEQLGQVTVFTDTDCGYCRRLHAEVPQLQAAGIAVRYVPFAHSGPRGRAYQTMRQVWCADDPAGALDIANGVREGDLPQMADCAARAIDDAQRLGMQLGIQGTPVMFLDDGHRIDGYMPATKLIATLQEPRS
jgi:thiol:disulfide interchange protein DsbC